MTNVANLPNRVAPKAMKQPAETILAALEKEGDYIAHCLGIADLKPQKDFFTNDSLMKIEEDWPATAIFSLRSQHKRKSRNSQKWRKLHSNAAARQRSSGRSGSCSDRSRTARSPTLTFSSTP